MTEKLIAAVPVIEPATGWPTIVPWAALVAGLIAIAVAWAGHVRNRNDRRRNLYGEAYRAVLEWQELYYRVRRRNPDAPYELVGLFHDAQEQINYYSGWISIESPALGRAYAEFASGVKRACFDLTRLAWAREPCIPEKGLSIPSDEHPQIDELAEQFLRDVRDHLRFGHRRKLEKRYPEKEGRSRYGLPRRIQRFL